MPKRGYDTHRVIVHKRGSWTKLFGFAMIAGSMVVGVVQSSHPAILSMCVLTGFVGFFVFVLGRMFD